MTNKDNRRRKKAELRRVRRKAIVTSMPMMDGGARIPEPKAPELDDMYLMGCEEKKENPGAEQFYKLVRTYVSEGGLIDIACGSGRNAYEASQVTSHKVVGVDINPKAIRMAKERYSAPNLEFVVGDVYSLLGSFGGFDLVIVSHSLHHFDDLPRAMDNIVGVVKPEGTVFIQDFDREIATSKNPHAEWASPEMAEIFYILKNYPPFQAEKMLRSKGVFKDRGMLTYFSCLAGYTVKEVITALSNRGIVEIDLAYEQDTPSYFMTAGKTKLKKSTLGGKIRRAIDFFRS